MPGPELDAAAAAVAETHISVIFFVGDRAWKLKKPVRFGFLDFSTPELRRAACEREVELNRRLAPDVYLGLAELLDEQGAVDHLVVMRRMPPDRRLSTLVESGDPSCAQHLDDVAALLHRFHARAERSEEIDQLATAGEVRRVWDESSVEIERFVGALLDAEVVERVTERYRSFLDGRSGLFAARIASGRVCDGHGDLQAEDVFCLDDGPRVLDCIEFDDRLRHGDVLADVGFLAMDLERLGAPELAERFVAAYAHGDEGLVHRALLHHYIAARAHVRCKVACLRYEQSAPGDSEALVAGERARRLLDLCDRHLAAAAPRLVLVGGTPGTGKSTLATRLAADRGWPVLRSDEVRKELAGVATTTRPDAEDARRLYAAERTDETYAELLARAEAELRRGHSVVLDASWIRQRHRALAAQTARDARAELVELRCVCPDAVARARIVSRLEQGEDASDATPEVARSLAAQAEPWPSAVEIRTEGSIQESLEAAERACGPW